MSVLSVRGIVLSSKPHKEHDRILRILTASHGLIHACAPGAGKPTSRHGPSSQPGALSDFCLSSSKDFMYLSESELVEPFRGIYEDIEKLTAASHLLEIASDASIDAEMTRSIYPLLVHAMYYLSEGKKSVAFVISAYEWKMMDLLGYASDLSPCKCGIPSTNTKNAFSFTRCKIYCTRSACLSEACDYQIISNGGLLALQYIQASDLKKIFAFNATDEIISEISNLSRRYMCERLDKKYCKMDMLLSAPQWE